MSKDNPELNPNAVEQNNQASNPEDAKAKFQTMLDRAKARGQEAGKKFGEGKVISTKNRYVDKQGERYTDNAEVKGLLEERDILGQAAEKRVDDNSEQSQAELQQIQARMAEIDQNPKVMEALQNEADRFKDNPEDIGKSEWELQVKKSKEKAGELAQALSALEAALKNFN